MFNKSDLETITIKILNDNPNQWFSQAELFDFLKKIYTNQNNLTSSNSELFIGHYLFVWEKLIINNNFIETCVVDTNYFIKINKINSTELAEINLETRNLSKLNVNLNEQITHMVDNPSMYYGSSLIKNFLINIYPSKYLNIYDILLDANSGLSNDLIFNFIDKYGEFLNINSNVIEYILSQPLEYREIKVTDEILKYLIGMKQQNNSNPTKPDLKSSHNFDNLVFYSLSLGVIVCSILFYLIYIKINI